MTDPAHRAKRRRTALRLAEARARYGGLTKREWKERRYGPFSNGPDVRVDPDAVPRAPEEFRSHVPAVARYVVREWLPRYPQGGRTARLRNDLAFRMKGGPSPKKKLDQEVVRAIAGEVARRTDAMELWENNRGEMKLMHPNPKTEEEEPTER